MNPNTVRNEIKDLTPWSHYGWDRGDFRPFAHAVAQRLNEACKEKFGTDEDVIDAVRFQTEEVTKKDGADEILLLLTTLHWNGNGYDEHATLASSVESYGVELTKTNVERVVQDMIAPWSN